MCIQMCKPKDQQGIVNEETQSNSQKQTNLSPQVDEDLSGSITSAESTTNYKVTDTSELNAEESETS